MSSVVTLLIYPAKNVNIEDMTNPSRPYHHGNLREVVLDTALDLVQKSGFADISIRAVARKIGVDARAVYRHFESKEDVFAALARRGFELLTTQMLNSLAHAGNIDGYSDSESKLIRIGEEYIVFAVLNPNLFQLMFQQAGAGELAPPQSEMTPNSYDLLANAWKEVTAEKGIEDAHSEMSIFSLWATVHGAAGLINHGLIISENRNQSELRYLAQQACKRALAGATQAANLR